MIKYQRLQNECGKAHFILEFLGVCKYFLQFGTLGVRVFMLIDGNFVLFGWGVGGWVHFVPPMYTKVHIVSTFK